MRKGETLASWAPQERARFKEGMPFKERSSAVLFTSVSSAPRTVLGAQ